MCDPPLAAIIGDFTLGKRWHRGLRFERYLIFNFHLHNSLRLSTLCSAACPYNPLLERAMEDEFPWLSDTFVAPTRQLKEKFWEDLKKECGDSQFQFYIDHNQTRLSGEYHASTNPIGPVHMEAYVQGEFVALEIVAEKTATSALVYWLPWKNRSVTKIERSVVEGSGCDFFLTTMLSGCRFVYDGTVLAHVANDAGHGAGTDQRGLAEGEHGIASSSASYRRLSCSDLTAPNIESYFMEEKDKGRAMVWGTRGEAGWSYKWLKHTNVAPKGKWFAFNI
jgi:hypothetical protein